MVVAASKRHMPEEVTHAATIRRRLTLADEKGLMNRASTISWLLNSRLHVKTEASRYGPHQNFDALLIYQSGIN